MILLKNKSFLVSGYSLPMEGQELKQELDKLVYMFDEVAIPS